MEIHGETSENAQEEPQECLFASDESLKQVKQKIQTYTDETFTGGHISYCLIGEKAAEEGLNDIAGFFASDEEIRYSGRIYIIKDKSAKEFLNETIDTSRELGKKLDNMEENIEYLSLIYPFKITDLLECATSENRIALIPVLEEIKQEENNEVKENQATNSETTKENTNANSENTKMSDFDFAGYAIINEMELIDYLTKDESRSCNFIFNKTEQTSIVLPNNTNEEKNITVSTVDSNCEISYEFNDDILEKVIFNLKVKCNIEDITFGEDIYTEEEVNGLQTNLEELLKKQLEEVIKKSKNIKVDFLNISKVLNSKHPYKYEKIKENWKNIWSEVQIEVNVEAQVQRKYDFLKTKE